MADATARTGELAGRTLVPGAASGPVLTLTAPLSFWGGVDPATGRVIDRRHPQLGAELAGRVVVLPAGRGSGSSSSVLAEAIRRGTAPAAIVLREPDLIIALGATVAAELYGHAPPVVVLTPAAYDRLTAAGLAAVTAGAAAATVRLHPSPAPPAAPAASGDREHRPN